LGKVQFEASNKSLELSPGVAVGKGCLSLMNRQCRAVGGSTSQLYVMSNQGEPC
jgi:hypothetical protein